MQADRGQSSELKTPALFIAMANDHGLNFSTTYGQWFEAHTPPAVCPEPCLYMIPPPKKTHTYGGWRDSIEVKAHAIHVAALRQWFKPWHYLWFLSTARCGP